MARINIDQMVELYHKHKGNHSRVAKEIGCTREYVRQKLDALGLTARGKVGGHRPNKGPVKYTAEYLRELYLKGEGRIFKMAKLAGVSSGVISSAIRRLALEDELRPKTRMGRPRKKKRVITTFVQMSEAVA